MKIKKMLIAAGLISLVAFTPEPLRAGSGYFSAQEFSYDFSGTLGTRDREDFDDDELGIGAGVNYFFTEHLGVGADTYLEEFEFPNHLDFSAIARWPLESVPVAPYIFGGFGRQWRDVAQWTGHIGIGAEYRWSEKMGAFFDARAVGADKSRDLCLYRLGVRFQF